MFEMKALRALVYLSLAALFLLKVRESFEKLHSSRLALAEEDV